MSPEPAYDTYLSLHFPSLETFLSTTCHLSFISRISQSTSSLLITIVLPPEAPSPWSSTALSTSTASSSSSSSSKASSPPPLSPTSIWLPLEQSLASIYSSATREFIRQDRVLAKVDVVIEQLRGIPICIPSSSKTIKWEYEPSSSTSTSTTLKTLSLSLKESEKDSFKVVALGGTFDHLHYGHKLLLTLASSITTEKLIVGISDDPLLGNKRFKEFLQGIEERRERVRNFLELIRPGIKHDVVKLQDVYGPTATEPDIQALVVSEETRSGAQAINKLRSERSLSTLETFVINLVSDDASENPSSLLDNQTGVVKVAVETKMGSTGIREWIHKQQQRQQSQTTVNGNT
ncbi:hypothetical protein JCM3765_005188 [Sporobolomyces pararoseus]